MIKSYMNITRNRYFMIEVFPFLLPIIIGVMVFSCIVFAADNQEPYTEQTNSVATKTDYYYESEGNLIYVLKSDLTYYLFLPNEADVTHVNLKSIDGLEIVFYSGDNEADSIDLNTIDKTEGYYLTEVYIRKSDGTLVDMFDLRIMKGSGIGTVYFISNNPMEQGRAWIDLSKQNRASGTAVVYDAEGKNLIENSDEQIVSDIHGRGNSSWNDPKKGYQLKFDKKVSLIDGAGKEKKWVLLAQYKDPLRMNDKICKDIGNITSSYFSPRAVWVNFYYDGEYRGVYELSEKNEIKSSRINIADMEDAYESFNQDYGNSIELETSMNVYGNLYQYQKDLTGPAEQDGTLEQLGGFLIEMNGINYDDNNGFKFTVNENEHAANVKSPDLGSKEAIKYISEYFQEFCDAVSATSDECEQMGLNPKTGLYYYDYCDIDSLVDTYLLQCVTSNHDAFWKSQYFYKDKGSKMISGPVWDMDLSFGTGWAEELPAELDYVLYADIAGNLIMNPLFREKVSKRYMDIYSGVMDSLAGTGELIPSFEQSFCLLHDNLEMDWVLWNEKMKCGDGSIKWDDDTSFGEIVRYRIDWITRHKAYLDRYFADLCIPKE